ERASRAAMIFGIDSKLHDVVTTIGAAPDYHPIGREGLALAMPHVDWTPFLTALGVPDARRIVLFDLKQLTQIDQIVGGIAASDLVQYLDFKLLTSWQGADSLLEGASADEVQAACEGNTAVALTGIVEHRFVDTAVGRKNTRVAMAMAQKELAEFR